MVVHSTTKYIQPTHRLALVHSQLPMRSLVDLLLVVVDVRLLIVNLIVLTLSVVIVQLVSRFKIVLMLFTQLSRMMGV